MATKALMIEPRVPGRFYRRMEAKLGLSPLASDRDLARLVEDRLPLTALEALSRHGMTDEEIFSYIVPLTLIEGSES